MPPVPLPPIIPLPRRFTPGERDLDLSRGVALSLSGPDPRLARAAETLLRDWERAGVPRISEDRRLLALGAPLRIDVAATTAAVAGLSEAGFIVPAEPEGIALTVDHSGAWIAGRDPAGAFYGLQALRQLFQVREGAPVLRGCAIEDWPAFSFRGVHLFPSAAGLPFHRRLVRDVLARYRVNHLVLECEHVRWDSHPEIHHPEGATPGQVRELLEEARANFITPVPLVASLGHGEWIFRGGCHLDLAEDPETPYACCPNNEETYRFLFSVFEEAIDLFGKPARFHVGLDEVSHRGRFPHHPRCRAEGAERLFVQHLRRLAGFLRDRGTETMLWADWVVGPGDLAGPPFAVPPEEVRRRLAQLPGDATLVDWQYRPADDYPSTGALRAAGRRVVGATFHHPENIRAFALAASHHGAEGMLQTTWAGAFPDASVLRTHREQFEALVLAGDYFWHPRPTPLADLGYSPGDEFHRAWQR